MVLIVQSWEVSTQGHWSFFAPVPGMEAGELRPGMTLLIYLYKVLGFYISSHGFKYHLGVDNSKLSISKPYLSLEPKTYINN